MKATRLIVLPTVQGRPELPPLRRPDQHGFARRHWFAVCTVVFVSVGLFWAANAYQHQAAMLAQLQREAASLNDDLTAANSHHGQLERQIDLLQSDAYIEMLARERLGMVKQGETTFTTRPPNR